MTNTDTMLSGICVQPGQFELVTRPLPQTAPEGWVLVDLAAVGLCGTDYHIYEGKHPYLSYPRAMEAGFAHVAHGGSYVLVSVVKDDLTFNDAEFHKREMRLIGSRNAQAQDFGTVIAALKSGAVPGEALISATLPLADLPRRIGELAADRSGIIKAVVVLAGEL